MKPIILYLIFLLPSLSCENKIKISENKTPLKDMEIESATITNDTVNDTLHINQKSLDNQLHEINDQKKFLKEAGNGFK